MTDSNPPTALTERRISRRRLLAIAAAAPAATVTARALPGRISTAPEPHVLSAASPLGATSAPAASLAPAGPAHWFC